jgi:hypothetical protein
MMGKHNSSNRTGQHAVNNVSVSGDFSIDTIIQIIHSNSVVAILTTLVSLGSGFLIYQLLPKQPVTAPGNSQSGMIPRATPPPSSASSDAPSANSAIRTWKSPDGVTQVDLVKAAVTGDLLTVELYYHSTVSPLFMRYSVDAVSYIDEATSQKYKVIEDESGTPMASPLIKLQDIKSGSNVYIVEPTRVGQKTTVVRFRFPAPPEQSKTISLDIPGIPEFGGVRVQR